MCGIAGIVDLSGKRPIPAGVLQKMADAIFHRGPDEEGFFERPGIGMASRRLSIVGLADGRQPIYNEDRSVAVVYNGELFDYPEMRQMLQGRGHRFATHCDTEIIPHLWEEEQEGLFDQMRGQFAFCLWDEKRQKLILARDRFGIRPLYWTRQATEEGEWLLFASEVKALLASGMVRPEADPRGIHHVFNFLALPGSVTCFRGVQLLLPGHYLRLDFGRATNRVEIEDRVYWQMDFPDQGAEERVEDKKQLVDSFEEVLLGAVERRLRADVPVVSYLSGGIDSSLVVALACKILGRPIPTFTIRIMEPTLDETSQAAVVSKHVGAEPVVVNCGDEELRETYPRLIWASEGPVVDTTGAAFLLLAKAVHGRGYKVAMTGEGSDEWMAGYPWYKMHKFARAVGLRGRYLYWRTLGAPKSLWNYVQRVVKSTGRFTAFHEFYTMMCLSRFRFFSEGMLEQLGDHVPYDDLQADVGRLKRWHPLNQALYWGARIHLGGLLLSLKGDRVSMHSSVETRYPFLDERVFDFLARLPPRWKLRGFLDKYLLRLVGERWLPRSTAWTPKGMFRAPLDSFFPAEPPAYVEQLMSRESLAKTGYFDVDAVCHWRGVLGKDWWRGRRRETFRQYRPGGHKRVSVELGLVGVLSTQLWHHIFIDNSLADLPIHWKQVLDGPRPSLDLVQRHN